MLNNEKTALKQNAEMLADLLTENIPFLLKHYLEKEVITEVEREAIVSEAGSDAIKVKLLETLADKENVSIDAVIEGLDATENHNVSKKINSLLSQGDSVKESDNGSGDKVEEVSLVASSLVDEVIAKAEETANSLHDDEGESNQENVDSATEAAVKIEETVVSSDANSQTPEIDKVNEEEEMKIEEKLVEASVEVHKMEEDMEGQAEKVEDVPSNELLNDDEGNTVEESVSSVTEHDNYTEEDENVEKDEISVNATPTPQINDQSSVEADVEAELDNEDLDNIDIEKEFEMPAESETNNNDPVQQSKISNGGSHLTEPESDDIVPEGSGNAVASDEKPFIEDEGLNSIMAQKGLIKKQVEIFEKNSPSTGAVKYSFRSSATDQDQTDAKTEGSNVKNLKNFFQRLSTTNESSTPSSTGSAKSVGKLKVTFPAS